MSNSSARKLFFRQSGWMTVAVLAGGAFNMGSNFVAARMIGHFNEFGSALSALGLMIIPALGLQASFASQTAVADTEEARRNLSSIMRGALGLMTAFWLVVAGWWLVRHEHMMQAYQLSHPANLWIVLFACLLALLTPVPMGVLQGRQDFLWFGWATLLNGLGRFVVLFLVVKWLRGGAMGLLAGVLAGNLVVLCLVLWRTRDTLFGPSGVFSWRPWWRLAPVTLGLGALTFINQADAVVVREHVQPSLTAAESDGYTAARTIASALFFLVYALTSVMYPKVARSFQRSEKSEALKLTILLTLAIGAAGAGLATLLPELPLRLLYPSALWPSKTLVPLFCWAMVAVSLASVMTWSLLARECYRSVPALVLVAGAYYVALLKWGDTLRHVIQIMGCFGVILVAVCSLFLWLDHRKERTGTPSPLGRERQGEGASDDFRWLSVDFRIQSAIDNRNLAMEDKSRRGARE